MATRYRPRRERRKRQRATLARIAHATYLIPLLTRFFGGTRWGIGQAIEIDGHSYLVTNYTPPESVPGGTVHLVQPDPREEGIIRRAATPAWLARKTEGEA